MADGALLEAVRGLWLADPELGPKPLLAKLREQQLASLGCGHQGGSRGAAGAEGNGERGRGGRRSER